MPAILLITPNPFQGSSRKGVVTGFARYGALDYQNFLSVVNMSLTDAAIINVYAYDNSGKLKGSTLNVSIPPSGKKTWRPSQIPPGSIAVPNDFEGSVVVSSSIPVVGQTNTIYPGTNVYGADGFDLFESALHNTTSPTSKIDNMCFYRSMGQ